MNIRPGNIVRLTKDITLSVSIRKGAEVGVLAVIPATATWKTFYQSDWIIMVQSPIGEYPVADHEVELVR